MASLVIDWSYNLYQSLDWWPLLPTLVIDLVTMSVVTCILLSKTDHFFSYWSWTNRPEKNSHDQSSRSPGQDHVQNAFCDFSVGQRMIVVCACGLDKKINIASGSYSYYFFISLLTLTKFKWEGEMQSRVTNSVSIVLCCRYSDTRLQQCGDGKFGPCGSDRG